MRYDCTIEWPYLHFRHQNLLLGKTKAFVRLMNKIVQWFFVISINSLESKYWTAFCCFLCQKNILWTLWRENISQLSTGFHCFPVSWELILFSFFIPTYNMSVTEKTRAWISMSALDSKTTSSSLYDSRRFSWKGSILDALLLIYAGQRIPTTMRTSLI